MLLIIFSMGHSVGVVTCIAIARSKQSIEGKSKRAPFFGSIQPALRQHEAIENSDLDECQHFPLAFVACLAC